MAPDPRPLALLCAVALEHAELTAALADARPLEVGRKPAVAGTLDGRPVLLLAGGMGKTNAAHAATALLEGHAVRGVLGFGVAGAYPGSGLAVGDVALATAAVYGDEGVDAPGGWLSTEEMGIPLAQVDGVRRFNAFPLDAARVERARAALVASGVAARTGPFLTVSACSGTTARGEVLARRFGALCEEMEGAAVAHVCALYGVPFVELRAVSNAVEDRDLSRWKLHEAAVAAQRAARVVAGAWD